MGFAKEDNSEGFVRCISTYSRAPHALDAGATLACVRDGLGRASVATTARYLHARPRDGLSRFLKV